MLGALGVDEGPLPEVVLVVIAQLHALEAAFLLNLLELFFELLQLLGRGLLVGFEVGALRKIERGQQLGDAVVAQAFVHLVEEDEIFVEHSHELGEGRAFEPRGAFAVAHHQAVGGALDHDFDELAVILDVLLRLAFLDRVQRRLCDVHVATLDQFLHVTEEKRQ